MKQYIVYDFNWTKENFDDYAMDEDGNCIEAMVSLVWADSKDQAHKMYEEDNYTQDCFEIFNNGMPVERTGFLIIK